MYRDASTVVFLYWCVRYHLAYFADISANSPNFAALTFNLTAMKTFVAFIFSGLLCLVSLSSFADDDKPKPTQPIVITVETESIFHGRTLDNGPLVYYFDGFIYVNLNYYVQGNVSIIIQNLNTGACSANEVDTTKNPIVIDIHNILSTGDYSIEIECDNIKHSGYFIL